MTRPYPFPAEAGCEPTLSEILADPIVHLVMQRDGLSPADIIAAIRSWRLCNDGVFAAADAA